MAFLGVVLFISHVGSWLHDGFFSPSYDSENIQSNICVCYKKNAWFCNKICLGLLFNTVQLH